MVKVCFKCQQVKPLSGFYRHKAMADGHLNKCIDCTKADVSKHRTENLEMIREYDRSRGSRGSDASKEWRRTDRRRMAAHNAVARALQRGQLQKMPCFCCGTTERVHAHHPSYDLPLAVVWLCAVHHKEAHKCITAA